MTATEMQMPSAAQLMAAVQQLESPMESDNRLAHQPKQNSHKDSRRTETKATAAPEQVKALEEAVEAAVDRLQMDHRHG